MGTFKLANRSSLTSALVLLTGASLSAGLLPSCGGEDITCGSGTHKNGSECVPNAEGSGGTGSNPENAPPTFDGIRSVAPAGDTALQVTWNAATDDATATEALVYNVYVATSAGGQNFGAPTVTSPPGAQSVLVAGLTAGTEYHIVVRAQDEAGAMDENTAEQSGTPEADDAPPTFGGITGAEAAGATEVKVSWDAATDDKTPAEGITYTVRWASTSGGAATGKVGAVSVPGASSVIVKGLPLAETSFFFNVRASDAAGNSESNELEKEGSTGKDTTPPVFGGCTGIGAPGATKATLSWDPARDDVETVDTMTYNVYAFTEPPDAETPFGEPQGS
ncbi:MAG: fibronectin type III domain-containing protein, partial [Myxococcales bacterium]|nr:fibronectin type III domain-containing protein [Myxococcales bacterium]